MGNIRSRMFQPWADKDVPHGRGGGSRQDTDLEVSITESAAEIEPRNRPTHNTDRLEENGKRRRGTGEAQAQNGGSRAPKRGTKRGATTESSARKKTKRSKNWTPAETQALIVSRLQASIEKVKLEWEAIAAQIPGKTGIQCQRRWDTVVKPYKKIKRHCDTHGKEFGQVTEDELVSMKVDNHWKRNNWYNLIDEYYRSRASAASGTGGAADLDTVEPPVSTSTAVRDVDESENPVTFWSEFEFLLDPADSLVAPVPHKLPESELFCYRTNSSEFAAPQRNDFGPV